MELQAHILEARRALEACRAEAAPVAACSAALGRLREGLADGSPAALVSQALDLARAVEDGQVASSSETLQAFDEVLTLVEASLDPARAAEAAHHIELFATFLTAIRGAPAPADPVPGAPGPRAQDPDDLRRRWAALISPPDLPLLESFVVESSDNLEKLDAALLRLEREPAVAAHYQEVFRPLHNIKGTGGFLGLRELAELCHAAEDLLDLGRDGRASLSRDAIELLFRVLDAARAHVGNLARALDEHQRRPVQQGAYVEVALAPLLADLAAALEALRAQPAPLPKHGESTAPTDEELEFAPEQEQALEQATSRAIDDLRRGSRSVKVDTGKLDGLLDMVGELVIAHSVVQHSSALAVDAALARDVEEVSRIVARLQDIVMSLRLLPARTVFARMERLVRDLSRSTGKPLALTLRGEETEVDKTILEQLHDPLVHLLRNAVDHGIEAARAEAGKPLEGRIRLQARHDAGFLVVEVDDDGRGIDFSVLRRRAQVLGRGEGLDDQGLLALLFESGFSTREVPDDLSGRGVGLDVVAQHVRELGGRVDVRPRGELGGASFSIRLPLTAAIVDGLLVEVAGERYVLPTVSVIEALRLDLLGQVKLGPDCEVVDVQGRSVPLVRMDGYFALDRLAPAPAGAVVVVVGDETRLCGLLVDRVLGRQQVVVKTLEGVERVEGIFAGAILGDGGVALILDIPGLIEAGRRWRPLRLELAR